MSDIDKFLGDKTANQKKPEAQQPSQIDSFLSDAPKQKTSAARKLGDLAVGFGMGAVGATKALADVAGADNAVSQGLEGVNKFLDKGLSYDAKDRQYQAQQIQDAAKGKGVGAEVAAGLEAFAVDPLQNIAQGAGSIAPFIAAQFVPGVGQSATATRLAQVGMGLGMGAGTVKGAIHEEVKKRELAAGKTEQQAQAAADAAQAYGGPNTDQIALGTALGGLDAATGAVPVATRLLRQKLGKEVLEEGGKKAGEGIFKAGAKGALAEMPTEFAQGGQEQLAANIAAQRAGYNADTWAGVAGQGTMEALAAGPMGAGFGIAGRSRGAGPQPQPDPNAPQANAPQTDGQPPATPLPGYQPDPLVAFPDGTVGRKGEVEQYVASLPEDQQNAARAKLYGFAPQPTQATDVLQGGVDTPPPAAVQDAFLANVNGSPYAETPSELPPSKRMGLDATTGPLSAAAVMAVDSGASPAAAALASGGGFGLGRAARGEPVDVTPINQAAGQIGATKRLGETPIIDVEARWKDEGPRQGDMMAPNNAPFESQALALQVAQQSPQGGEVVGVPNGFVVRPKLLGFEQQIEVPTQQPAQAPRLGYDGERKGAATRLAERQPTAQAPQQQPAQQKYQPNTARAPESRQNTVQPSAEPPRLGMAPMQQRTPRQRPPVRDGSTPIAMGMETYAGKDIPKAVKDKLKFAVSRLNSVKFTLDSVKKARGDGHHLATEVARQKDTYDKYASIIADFKQKAEKIGVNLSPFLAEIGDVSESVGAYFNKNIASTDGNKSVTPQKDVVNQAAGAFAQALAGGKSRDDAAKAAADVVISNTGGDGAAFASTKEAGKAVTAAVKQGLAQDTQRIATTPAPDSIAAMSDDDLAQALGIDDGGNMGGSGQKTVAPEDLYKAAGAVLGTPKPQGSERAPVAKATTEPPARPANWRTNMISAAKVAKGMGITAKGKKLVDLVAEIDAADVAAKPSAAEPPTREEKPNRGNPTSTQTDAVNTATPPVAHNAAATASNTSPFQYNGLKIRTSRIKVGDEVQERWVVQSPENAEREARGERQIGGDRIVDTREQAIHAAEQESKAYAERKALKEQIDAEDDERKAQNEAKKEANRGKSVVERRRDAFLDSPSKVGSGTKREVIEAAVRNGYAIVEKTVRDTASKKRDREAVDRAFRAGYILGLSNENIPIVKEGNAAQARLKEDKYEKPEYRIYSDSREDGPFREISKIEYEYAQKLKKELSVDAANPSAEPPPTAAHLKAADAARKVLERGGDKFEARRAATDELISGLKENPNIKITDAEAIAEREAANFDSAGQQDDTMDDPEMAAYERGLTAKTRAQDFKKVSESKKSPQETEDVRLAKVREAEAKAKKDKATQKDQPTTQSSGDDILDAELSDALGKLGDVLGDVFGAKLNITGQKYTAGDLLPALSKVVELLVKKGLKSFSQSTGKAAQLMRADPRTAAHVDSISPRQWKAAYNAIAEGFEGTDSEDAINALKADEVLAIVAPTHYLAQNKQPNAENKNATPDKPDQKALENIPAKNDSKPERGGEAGASPASGGEPSSEPDSGADGGRVSAARGGRGGASRVSDPATRAASGRRPRGAGADGAGTRVPQTDAGLSTPETSSAPNIPAVNFAITPDLNLGVGGEVAKFNDNIAAIKTLKALESERRRATPSEQRVLARFVGWGGLANAFPNPETGKFKPEWEKRGNELRELLTPSEYRAASRSTRNAHYTSEVVVEAMWNAVRRLGYRNGLALESSMGSGNFLGLMPNDLSARFIGVEYDSITARLAGALYPQATVLHSGFQDVALPEGVFDLDIGNPPFGSESLRFQYKPELRGVSIHNQFFRAGVDALRPGGLKISVVSSFLMDAQDTSSRMALAIKAKLIAAIRLPSTAFKENARTDVVTDIIILQRRSKQDEADATEAARWITKPPNPKELREMGEAGRHRVGMLAAKYHPEMSWVKTSPVPDPLGGEPILVNSYFAKNPSQIVGVMDRSGTMRTSGMMNVRLEDPSTLGERLGKLVAKLPQDIVSNAADVAERTEQAYKLLGEAMRISVARQEPGHMSFDEDGKLTRVIEREYSDSTVLQRQTLTPKSPWSAQLFVDSMGRWYKVDVRMDAAGNPVKVAKDGKATKLNEYVRTIYENEADIPDSMRLGQLAYDRLLELVGMRDLLKRQLVLETEDAPKLMMEGNRKKLAKAYQAYVDKHGPINRRANAALLSEMPDGGLVLALESSYEPARTAEQAKKSGLPQQGETVKPAPIMTERVVPKYEPPTSAETPADALAITLAERGVVDIEHIAKLLKQTPEQAEAALSAGDKPLVFKDPETNTFETANAYLSGQVRRKLMAAKSARLEKNVKALEAVQPERWGAENVSVQIGASWVPPRVYADFAEHLLGGQARVNFSALTNTFSVAVVNTDRSKADQWRTERMNGATILNKLLNSQTPTVIYTDSDGKIHTDKEATTLAILKGKEIVAEFGNWIFKDRQRREELVDIFNEKFNTRVTRQYDGQHLKLPGKVPDQIIKMRRHQMNAIWRGISSRSMLVDHTVGAGKTYTAIARAMERRRMGLAQKPTVVVPNHLVEQWAADVYRLYPAAKVLAATKKDFEKKNRRRLLSRVATGDYDIVILPHSSFGFVGISPETELRYLEEELRQAVSAVKEAQKQAEEDGDVGFRKPMGVKEAERLVAKIEGRMAKVREGARDNLLTFEQLGIDDLTIDEAHEFKNLFYSSRLTKVRGMGDKLGSRKAADLYDKVRVLRDNGGAVTFLTGTPVSNSVVELYTMMRYLAPNELREMGMEHFDAWRAQFVDATPAFEPNESGRLQEVTRLGRTWSNMRNLMDLYYGFTDAVTNDDIKQWYKEDNEGKEFPIPKVKGGERQLRKVAPTPAQESYLKEIIAGFDGLPYIKDVQERNAERLRLMDRARKLSLDIRAALPTSTSKEEGGKLDQIAAEVKRIYDKFTPDLGTQLIFLDRSVPKAKGDDKKIKEFDDLVAKRDKALKEDDDATLQKISETLEAYDAQEIEELRRAQAGGWNAYQQLKDNLISLGIPPAEIRFVQDANTDEQKQALFDAVNGGKVRVLIGSTPRMGAGTNVQERLVGLHHADVTWKPSDIEQREGRIIRQKNQLLAKYGDKFEVEILAYATERTVDAKMWSLNATKLKAINGLRKYTGDFTMDLEDEESVSMAEMAALASGNPLLLERVTLESEIQNLELQERSHQRKIHGAEDALARAEKIIATYPDLIAQTRRTAEMLAKPVQALNKRAAERRVTVEGVTFDNYKDAMKAAVDAVALQQVDNENARYAITVNGQRLTNKAGIDDAIGVGFGDASPFEVDIQGEAFTQRTAAGRALSALLSPKAMTKTGSGTAGAMFGLELKYEFSKSKFVDHGVDVDVWLESDGKTIASDFLNDHNPNIQYTTAQMRDLLGRLAEYVESKSRPSMANAMQAELEAARSSIPNLEERAREPFQKAQELKDKRQRLNEVVGILTAPAKTGQTTQATSDPAATDNAVKFSRATASPELFDWADREFAPVGSWVKTDYKIAGNQPLVQVRDLSIDDLYLPELDEKGRLQPEKTRYLDEYTERVRSGESPPSISVIETEKGRLRVTDGHRRVMAAKAAGKKTIRALVSPLVDTPDGKKEATAENIGLAFSRTSAPFDGKESGSTPIGNATEIEVDGVMRPTLNSKGQVIHPTQEGVRNFWRWFGDSQQTDSDNQPIVYHHYGNRRIEKLGGGNFGGGLFVLENQNDASGYGSIHTEIYLAGEIAGSRDLENYLDDLPDGGAEFFSQFLRRGVDSNLDEDQVEAFRDVVIGEGGFDEDGVFEQLTGETELSDAFRMMQEIRGKLAKVAGFSAVHMEDEFSGDAIMVVAPDKIKSATGNQGAFDPNDADIRKSGSESLTQSKAIPRTPAANIRKALEKAYGKLFARLESKGLVTLAQTKQEAIEAAAKARAEKLGTDYQQELDGLMAAVSASRVWHGTAQKGIKQFSTRFLLKGEGANFFGAGLYFTESEDIAEWYRQELSADPSKVFTANEMMPVTIDGKQVSGGDVADAIKRLALLVSKPESKRLTDEYALAYFSYAASQSADAEINQKGTFRAYFIEDRQGEAWAAPIKHSPSEAEWDFLESWLKKNEKRFGYRKADGQVYEVEIPEDEAMLLWDKPIGEQSAFVFKALRKSGFSFKFSDTGKDFYENAVISLSGAAGRLHGPSQAAVSLALRKQGIKGIKYPAGTVTKKGGIGLSNYVIFDGADTKIVDVKYSSSGLIQGFFDPATKHAYMVADALFEDTAGGVLMHEVGIHMAASGGKLAPLVNRAAFMVKNAKGAFFDDVRQKMAKAGETSAEEAAAYLVEAYENSRDSAPSAVKQWFKDFMAAVRAWLFRAGRGLVLRADQLTAADIAAVARANAKRFARGGVGGGSGQFLNRSFDGRVEATAENIQSIDDEAMFSRQRAQRAFSPAAKKQAIDAVQSQVSGIKATWKNAPDVVVAFDMNDPVIPEAVRKKDQAQRSSDAGGAPEGFYYQGKVYLMASKLPTARDTTRVLFHEALGHHGLRGVFGESLHLLLRQIVTMRKQEIKAKIEDYKRRGVKHISPLVAAEEMLAEMAENAPDVGFARRAIAAIKQWLKDNIPGFDGMKFTDDDIVSLFIVPARRFVEGGDGNGPNGGGGVDSGIRFSRAGGDGKPPTGPIPAYFDVLGDASGATKEAISDRLADWRGMGMQVLGRRQIVDLWHKLLPQLSTYDDLVQRMDAEKNAVATTADNMVRAWGELDGRKFGIGVPKHPGMERKLAEVMHDATLRGVDADPLVALPSDANVIQKAAKADLKQRFEALTPEAQAIYRQARDDYKEQHQAIRKALKERIKRSAEISPDSKRTMIARMEEELGWEKKGVYFPLARFGKYVVVAKDANGKTVSVSRAESLPEAKAMRLMMMAKMPAGTQVSKVYLDAEFNAARDGVGKGFAADLIKSLRAEGVDEGVIDSVGQLYLKSLPDLSWAKHGIHRKGMAGFSDDARRAYAQNVIHGASHLAKLRYADKLGLSLLEMQNHIKLHQDDEGFDNVKAMQVYDEMTKRHENLMNPKSHPVATALTSFGFVYFLGLSPASAAVNLSQTALLAYPLMGAKWGYDKAGAALMTASAEVMRAKNDLSNVLSGDELKAFQRAVADGTIDVTQAHDLAGIAGGEDQRVTWALRPVMRAASFMFHHAERFNRQATFIAAYRLAKAASPSITEDQAFEQAKKATYDGHFDMSASNRPRIMQGNWAKVLLLFKQFGQNMAYTLMRQTYLSMKGETPEQRREARRALAGILTLHGMAAGALGLPVVGILLSLASAIGGDDDDPWDAEVALKNMLAESLGQKPAEVLAHGLSRLTPWDISGRVALNKLILPDVQEGLEGRKFSEAAMAAALGPIAGVVTGIAQGTQLMSQGDYQRGFEAMMPVALKGLLKSIRFAQEGNVDRTGVVINDEVSTAGVLGQAVGFSPSETRLAAEGRQAIRQADKRIEARRSNLVRLYALSKMADDQEGMTETMEMIASFNRKNPDRKITLPQLAQSIKSRQKRIDEAQQGVYLPRTRRGAMEAGQFAVVE